MKRASLFVVPLVLLCASIPALRAGEDNAANKADQEAIKALKAMNAQDLKKLQDIGKQLMREKAAAGRANPAMKAGADARADAAKAAAAAKAAKDAKDAAKKDDANDPHDPDAADAKARNKGDESNHDKDDDSVQMIAGDLVLYGKIHKELPDAVIILMRKDQARIRIPREKIKALNYSMATRLSAINKDDLDARYKVGLWAMEKSMYPDAIEVFESIKAEIKDGKEGPGPDLYKQLGRAYQERAQLDKAYENYSLYLRVTPDDKEVAEIATKLEAEVKPKVADAPKPTKPIDGLEADGNWQAETWPNANPAQVAFTTDKFDNKMVLVSSTGGANDKSAFSRYGQPLNLSDSTEMQFKIYNDSDKQIKLSCAFINAEGDFHETIQFHIPPREWYKQLVKIDGKVFKSNHNNFEKYDQELRGKDHVSKLTFMIYSSRPSKLFIDALFFK